MHTVELYRKVRLACRDGMSERAAARHFGVSRQSVRKMLRLLVPPGYRRTAPVRRPKLDEFTELIEQWLGDDRRHGYGYRQVWVRGYVDRVVIGCGAEVIARHPRSYEGEDMVFDPLHYLPLIERKIGALDQAAPLAGWELPDAFATLRRLTEARSGRAGRREYVQVLRLFETFGLDDVHAAVRHALRLGAIGFDAVKHLVLCRVEKRPPKLDLNVYPYLPKANVDKTCAASYLCLPTCGGRLPGDREGPMDGADAMLGHRPHALDGMEGFAPFPCRHRRPGGGRRITGPPPGSSARRCGRRCAGPARAAVRPSSRRRSPRSPSLTDTVRSPLAGPPRDVSAASPSGTLCATRRS